MADLALSVLTGSPRHETLFAYDGLRDRLREVPVTARPACPLCGDAATISAIDELCYTARDSAVSPIIRGVEP